MKANLSCEECQRELVALIDGALTPSVARVVEGHAASCASCGRALLDFRGQALRLRRMELYPVPASLEGRVLRELRVARGFLNAGWQRISAAVGAVSFVLLVGILANLARIAKGLGIPDPYVWLVSGIDHSISGITSVLKWLAGEIAVYVPLLSRIWVAVQALRTLPRAAIVSLRTPEVQIAGAILVTLGLALYIMLRPSRRNEGSVGHVCLSL
ncbi:MAG: zf-HC2 domain-containing protein [Candidatus Eisenbacteria bacterium]|uniref:Zf-HC2 domain-containing protein n=1 Tax=Eiseniibacteriota bacterium TaxID=2212470 RepID=A0A538SEL5_UNCEI|nr:MAG: zf-HC2 domain-containing protein [Candidatus Eisenbacteria bacterium]